MKFKYLLIFFIASVLSGTEAFADNTYGWDAATNENLYTSAIIQLKTIQTQIVGEPAYYMTQEFMLRVEAAHKTDQYAWMAQFHNFCNTLEAIYCPQLEHPRICASDKYEQIRRNIMKLRDFPMHEVSLTTDSITPSAEQIAAFNKSNLQNLKLRRSEFFELLASPRPTEDNEIQIFKLYSSGFVFRTRKTCIGLDICYKNAFGDTSRADELAGYLDALFITHAHGDHYDETVLKKVYENGKALVMPSAIVTPVTGNGTKFIWSSDHLESTAICSGVKASAKMAAQGTEPNLLYMIEIDGWRIIAVGDNSETAKESFYSGQQIADIIIAPIFQGVSALCGYTYSAPNPLNIEQVYINAHENEYHHTVDHRVAFKYLFSNNAALGNGATKYPLCSIIDNGEAVYLKK